MPGILLLSIESKGRGFTLAGVNKVRMPLSSSLAPSVHRPSALGSGSVRSADRDAVRRAWFRLRNRSNTQILSDNCARALSSKIQLERRIPLTNGQYIEWLASSDRRPINEAKLLKRDPAVERKLRDHPELLFMLGGNAGKFGERLKAARIISRIACADLARAVIVKKKVRGNDREFEKDTKGKLKRQSGSMTVSQLSGYENEKGCDEDYIKKFADLLNVPRGWFIYKGNSWSGEFTESLPDFLHGYAEAALQSKHWWMENFQAAFEVNVSLRTSTVQQLTEFLIKRVAETPDAHLAYFPLLHYWPWCVPTLRRTLVEEPLSEPFAVPWPYSSVGLKTDSKVKTQMRKKRLLEPMRETGRPAMSFEDHGLFIHFAKHHPSTLVDELARRMESYIPAFSDYNAAPIQDHERRDLMARIERLAVPDFDPTWLDEHPWNDSLTTLRQP